MGHVINDVQETSLLEWEWEASRGIKPSFRKAAREQGGRKKEGNRSIQDELVGFEALAEPELQRGRSGSENVVLQEENKEKTSRTYKTMGSILGEVAKADRLTEKGFRRCGGGENVKTPLLADCLIYQAAVK